MICKEMIRGKYCDLKSIDESDAEFTLNIRKDPEFVKYLPRLDHTIEQQKAWIRKQQVTEGDYFFVMLDKDGNRFGTLGIYDADTDIPKGRSLAAKGNSLQNIEAVYLIYKFALEELKVNQVCGWVYIENTRAARFNELFGGVMGETYVLDGKIVREVTFKNPEFEIAEKKVRKMLYRER